MTRNRTDPLQVPETLVVGVDDRGMSDHAVRAAVELGARLGANLERLHAVRVPILEWMGSDATKGPAALGQALENAEPVINEHVRQLLDTARASDLHASSPAHDVGLPSRAGDAPGSRDSGAAFFSRTSDPSYGTTDVSSYGSTDVSSYGTTDVSSYGITDVGSAYGSSDLASSDRASGVGASTLAADLHVRVVPGTPTEVLVAAAQQAGSSIIFLGQHEKRGSSTSAAPRALSFRRERSRSGSRHSPSVPCGRSSLRSISPRTASAR